MNNTDNKSRCSWVPEKDPLYIEYHDQEWGVPEHDDQKLFEMLILEGAQAGLSWITVLRKRENYQQLFDQFDPEKIIHYDEKKIASLLENPGIIRNKLKVNSVVINAKLMIEIQQGGQSFSDYLWQFVDGKPIINKWKTFDQVPVSTPESDAMSKDLKKRGFKFIGTTICYAFMQATGMVNDHTTDCFCYKTSVKR